METGMIMETIIRPEREMGVGKFVDPGLSRAHKAWMRSVFAILLTLFAGRSSAPAQSWTAANVPTNYWTWIASSADGRKLAASALNDGVYLSSDSGATWVRSSAPGDSWFIGASSADGSKLVVHSTHFKTPP